MMTQVWPQGNREHKAARHLWAIVLAGSDGTTYAEERGTARGGWRSRQRPHQFCRVGGPHTLFRQAIDRASRLVPPERVVGVLSREHAPFYERELLGVPGIERFIQPADRGSAPEILLPAVKIAVRDPEAFIVVLPSDHLVDHDVRFMRYVAKAAAAASARPDLAIVIGARPLTPDPAPTWIEPGEPIRGLESLAVRSVRRFVHNPSAAEAESLYGGDGLLSTLVIIARARTIVELGRRCVPELMETLEALKGWFGDPVESLLCDAVYEALPHASMSREVLHGAEHFAVLPIPDVMWSDWTRPAPYALAS